MSVRPIVTAASLRSAADRLPERRVRDESTLPPEILLLGARQSQEVKCSALGQAERSSPHSAINLSARYGSGPLTLHAAADAALDFAQHVPVI